MPHGRRVSDEEVRRFLRALVRDPDLLFAVTAVTVIVLTLFGL